MLRWQGLSDKIIWPQNDKYDVDNVYKAVVYKNEPDNIRYVEIPGQGHKINNQGYNIFRAFIKNPKDLQTLNADNT